MLKAARDEPEREHDDSVERRVAQEMQLEGQTREVERFATPGSRRLALPPLPARRGAAVEYAHPRGLPVALARPKPLFTPEQVRRMEDLKRSAPMFRARRPSTTQEDARRMLRDLEDADGLREQAQHGLPQKHRLPNGHGGQPTPQHEDMEQAGEEAY